MSAPNSSSTGTITPPQQCNTGGTSFLDLPLELREMIYDLCAPKEKRRSFRLPLITELSVKGINLLRCSKQVHDEVARRLDLWESTWILILSSPSLPVETSPDIDCSLAMSCLHDLALAKIRSLGLILDLDTSTPATFGVYGLEVLLKFTSLNYLNVHLHVNYGRKYHTRSPVTKSDLANLPFFTGLVVRLLSHVPTSVPHVGWFMYYPGITSEAQDTFRKVVQQYKSVRGSAYISQEASDSSY